MPLQLVTLFLIRFFYLFVWTFTCFSFRFLFSFWLRSPPQYFSRTASVFIITPFPIVLLVIDIVIKLFNLVRSIIPPSAIRFVSVIFARSNLFSNLLCPIEGISSQIGIFYYKKLLRLVSSPSPQA